MLMEARLLDERREVKLRALPKARRLALLKRNSLLLNVCWLRAAILSRLLLSLQIYLSLMWRS